MSDFLQHIVARFTSNEPVSRPRLPSLFEPLAASHAALPPNAALPVDAHPVNLVAGDAVAEQPASFEPDSAPRSANLDAQSHVVGEERLGVESAARPQPAASPIAQQPITRKPDVSKPRPTATAASQADAPAAVRDAGALSSPARSEQGDKTIAEPQHVRSLFVPIETTRQASKISLAAPRPLPEQIRAPSPQPAEIDASPRRSRGDAESPSPVSSRQQARVELPLASRERDFTLTVAALNPPVAESPFSAPRLSDARRAERSLAEFADVPAFAAAEPKTAPLPIPATRTMALTTPRAETQRFVRPVQSPAPVTAPPTINVTIGRVEITATPASAAPRPTRKTSPVMTLEAYLRRNAGGGG